MVVNLVLQMVEKKVSISESQLVRHLAHGLADNLADKKEFWMDLKLVVVTVSETVGSLVAAKVGKMVWN